MSRPRTSSGVCSGADLPGIGGTRREITTGLEFPHAVPTTARV